MFVEVMSTTNFGDTHKILINLNNVFSLTPSKTNGTHVTTSDGFMIVVDIPYQDMLQIIEQATNTVIVKA